MNSQNCEYKVNAFDEYTTPWQGFLCTCPAADDYELERSCPYANDWSVGRCPHLFPSMANYAAYVITHLHEKHTKE